DLELDLRGTTGRDRRAGGRRGAHDGPAWHARPRGAGRPRARKNGRAAMGARRFATDTRDDSPAPERRARDSAMSTPNAAEPPANLPILEFILRNYKNFNSRATRDATLAYWRHIEGGGKMYWAVAGAMSSAQLGITLAPAIRAGLIHGMSVTGANLEESLFRLVAHDSYKDFPDYRYFTKEDDTKILENRMRRVTDTSIPEDEAFRVVEKQIVPTWKKASETGERRFWHEYFYELIQAIDPKLHQGPADECW